MTPAMVRSRVSAVRRRGMGGAQVSAGTSPGFNRVGSRFEAERSRGLTRFVGRDGEVSAAGRSDWEKRVSVMPDFQWASASKTGARRVPCLLLSRSNGVSTAMNR